MNTCMKCAHKNVCEWCIDDSDCDFPTCSDFLEERPQGEWVMEDKPFGGFGDSVLAITCSICKESYVYRDTTHNFCPNCGADMRGIKHE